MMTIESIDHVQLTFPVALTSQIRLFYKSLPGLLELVGRPGDTLRFRVGGQRIDLVPVEFAGEVHEAAHLALRVRDLPDLRARLLAARVEIDDSRPLPGHQRFYLKDPAGNTLEFLQAIKEEVAA